MSNFEVHPTDLPPSRHIIHVDPDGPEVDTEEFLEELDSYQEQFENNHFEALESGQYIAGYDPLESSLVEILVRYTSLSMVQLPGSVRLAITQLSLQFEQILTSNTLALEVRKLLGYMQIPLLRMAIADEDFGQNANNAALRLFYKMSDVAALWHPVDNALIDTVYKQLAMVIHELRERESLTDSFCERKLADLIRLSGNALTVEHQQEEQNQQLEDLPVTEAVIEKSEALNEADPLDEKAAQELDPLREMVENINVGVRLEYSDGTTTHKLKVAAVLPSSGEIVLVTRSQEKYGSFDRDDIYEAIKEGTMVIDEETLQYSKTLESVIGGLRK